MALERLLAARITAALLLAMGDLQPLMRNAVTVALCSVGRGIQVPPVAAALNMSERTLRRRLRDETGSITPQAVIGWARIPLSAWRLRDRARPAVDIANALCFSAAPNLHRSLKEYTGLSMGEAA